MKIKDLILELGNYDPEMVVLVDGYESGYDEVRLFIRKTDLSNPEKRRWYDGKYKESTNANLADEVLVLSR